VTDIGSFPHQVTRLVFDTGQPNEEFRARYEAAVPALDEKRLAECITPLGHGGGRPPWVQCIQVQTRESA
jgi:hypothetical protein